MMQTLYWLSAFLIVWAYFGYLVYLLVKPGLQGVGTVADALTPKVSVITTVFNEQDSIVEKVENCLAIDYPGNSIEFIFVSDGSTDETISRIAAFANDSVMLVDNAERRGKDFAQSDGVACSSGDILVFTDAKTMLARDAISELVKHFFDPKIGCVSGYDVADDEGTGSGEGAYVRYEMKLRELETAAGSTVVVSGCFFGVRRELCDDWYPGLTSDFYLPIIALQSGFRVVLAKTATAAYRVSSDAGHEFSRKVRTVVNGLDVLARFRSILNPFKYGAAAFAMLSHKLLRWLVPWALLFVFVSNLALVDTHAFYAVTMAAQILFYAAAAFGLASSRALSIFFIRIPFFFLMVNLSILVAWFYFFTGKSVTIWNPTER